MIRSVRGFVPDIGEGCFISETAVIIGDLIMGEQCSVWYNTVIRGDVNSIRIGNRVNIQDGCILHTTFKTTTIRIGDDVSIGHGAIIHGADIGDEVLIGMGAIVMDHVRIGKHAIIAAGALLPEHTVVPPGTIYAGIPARQTGTVTKQQVNDLILRTARNYLMYARWYMSGE
jgi:carbonic anhydrase/acetyltransferase-like protein (isoleucine patch superfamily)